ncbi:lysophospholipid acyltransferase family protein [Salinisphaera hydrothermalis]|uniref:lysophospholipid acyltransferase family protein n=1 Tax=Salinisphaera hydrothermalis TaxID=563188 RepID=UPI003341DCAB
MARFYFSGRRSHEVTAWRRRMMWWAEAAVLRSMIGVLRVLPLKMAFSAGAVLGEALGRLSPRVDKVRRNLRIVFPNAGRDKLERITRASFANVGVALAELANLDRLWRNRGRRVEFNVMPGAKVPSRDRQSVFVTAHFGPWQLTPLIGRYYDVPLPVIYAPEQNPYVDRTLNRLRGVFANRLVSRDGGMRMFMRSLSRGESIGLTVDTRLDSGEAIPFFGHPAMTNTAPARLALRFDCDLVPVLAERLSDGRFRVNIHPPITPSDADASRDEKVLDMSRQINALFEAQIVRHPDQWLCLKRRWPKAVHEQHA